LKRGELKSYEINQYRHKVKTGQRLMVINIGGELGRFAVGGLPWYKYPIPTKPSPVVIEPVL